MIAWHCAPSLSAVIESARSVSFDFMQPDPVHRHKLPGTCYRLRAGAPSRRTAAGFSLIELMAVLAILAILAAAAFPLARVATQHSKEQELRYSLRQLREGIDAYKRAVDEGRIAKKVGESGYPKSLDDLVKGVEDQRDPNLNKSKVYFLRRIPRDPMAVPGVAAAESWGKRSYASPPDEPRDGDDVFDVFSLNESIGLNGISYRQW